jgi:hypothetical protein
MAKGYFKDTAHWQKGFKAPDCISFWIFKTDFRNKTSGEVKGLHLKRVE